MAATTRPSAVTAARPHRGCRPAGTDCSGAELVVTVPPTADRGPGSLRSPTWACLSIRRPPAFGSPRASPATDLAGRNGGRRRASAGDPVEHFNGGPAGPNRQDHFRVRLTAFSHHE